MQTQLGTRSGLAAAHAPRCLVPTGLPRSRRSLRAHASAGARVEPSSSTSWSSAVGDDRDAAQTSTTASAPPGAINPGAVVEAFVASLNSRSFEDIEVLLAPDCVLDDLTHNQVFSSSAAVANALRAVVGATSMGMRLAMETVRVHRFSMNVSLTWHLEVAGVAVPGTTGHSFYRVNSEGRICYIRDSPAHFLRAASLAAAPAAALAAPVFQALGPAAAAAAASPQQLMSLGLDYLARNAPAVPFVADLAAPMGGDAVSGSDALGAVLSNLFGATPSIASIFEPGAASAAADAAAASSSSSIDAADAAGAAAGMRFVGAAAVMDAPPGAKGQQHADDTVAVSGRGQRRVAMRTLDAPDSAPDAPAAQPAPGPQQAPVSAAALSEALSGVWEKDLERSQVAEYEAALGLLGLSAMQKATAKLIEGLELHLERGDAFAVDFLTIIPFFKVTERFRIGGATRIARRDLRSGQCTTTAQQLPSGTGVVVTAQWGQPYAGHLREVYACPVPGELHVESSITVGGITATTVQVYKRGAASRQELLARSQRRNGSATDVLRGFGMPKSVSGH